MCRIAFEYNTKKKEDAEKFLKEYDLSLSDAMEIFLDAVVMNEGMPNAAALEDAEDIWRAKKVRKAIKEGKVKLIPTENVYRKLGL